MSRTPRRHWWVALAAALLVHAGVAAALLWQGRQTDAATGGSVGMEISLGSVGGAADSPARSAEMAEPGEARGGAAPETPVTEEVEPVDVSTQAVELVEAVVPEVPLNHEDVPPEIAELRLASAEAAEPETPEIVESIEIIQPIPLTDNSPEAVMETAPVVQMEMTEADTQPLEPVVVAALSPVEDASSVSHAEVAAVALPVRRPPPPKPQPQTVQTRKPEAAATTAATPVDNSLEEWLAAIAPSSAPGDLDGATVSGGTTDGGEPAESSGGGGALSSPESTGPVGGGGAETADYMARLQAWLERHKGYPRKAKLRRQEGTGLLYFAMDGDGRVLEYRLERSSGHDLLDREIAEMIERAQPLPRMPETMQQARLELVVPVQFSLR